MDGVKNGRLKLPQLGRNPLRTESSKDKEQQARILTSIRNSVSNGTRGNTTSIPAKEFR
jgi:hypothetical protein